MNLAALTQQMLPAIETELQVAAQDGFRSEWNELYRMIAYHMGWEGEGAGAEARGKRIRPLLVTLVSSAAGEDWRAALPAAAAVELIHNFSLIHDDIEDNSSLRRGRQTVWLKWGIPQAINAGDALFTLAHLALLKLEETAPTAVLPATRMLQQTCLKLTQGQYLDMANENRSDISLDSYWLMVGSKTAALIECCTGLGALIGGADLTCQQHYREFGRDLGLAFQAQDDLLGIWGDAELTGKSAQSDLATGKNSLPVLFGLQQGGNFAHRWAQGPVEPAEVPYLASLLENEGARAYSSEAVDRLTKQALNSLDAARPQGAAGIALSELAHLLLSRPY